MIKITLSALKKAEESLKKILTQDLPISQAYLLSRFGKKIITELDIYEEHRNKLILQFGKQSEDGSYIVENNEEFTKELTNLLNTEIEIDINLIDLNTIKDYIKLSAIDLINLEFLLLSENQ